MTMKVFIIFILFFAHFMFAQDSLLFVIRVDDIQSRNTTIVPRSIKFFQSAVEKRGGKITWAVIPHRLIETQNQDCVLADELRESLLNGHEVAMHGYNHICLSCNQSGHEMFCTTNNLHFSYIQQLQLIADGLKILYDSLNIIPQTFVPPGHQADTVTYQTLVDKGFDWLSSTGSTKNFIFKTLYNLQQNNEYTWQLTASQYNTKLSAALQEIKSVGTANGYYCLLLHDYFIRQGYENGIVINWIGELLDSLNKFYENKIKYVSISEAANIFYQQTTTHISDVNLASADFVLYQNYPNPFNPSTKISWQTQANGWQTLKIYDVLGKEIATLIDEFKSPGTYTIEFNSSTGTRNLASGIYYYRLQVGDFIQTKKLILLR